MKTKKELKALKEEAKKEVQTEEEGVQLTDEELSSVSAGVKEPVCKAGKTLLTSEII